MKYKLIISSGLFIALTVLISSSLHAQTKQLTLQEAIDLSLKNSKQLKIQEAKIHEAANAVKEAEEKRLPDAGISGSYLYLPLKPNINLKTGAAGSGAGPNVSQALYGSANVSVSLFNAGKFKYGIESAKYLEQAIKLDSANDRQQVILNTTNACINLYIAKEAIELVKENLAQSQQRVKDFSNLEKNGLLPRNDLLKAELQSSNIELTLLDAESNYKMACVNMNLIIGWPEQTEIIPDKTGIALPTAVKTLAEYENEALQKRNDIAALSFRKKAALNGMLSAKTDYYPGIAFTGGLIDAYLPNFLTLTNAVNIGIGIKYNLSSLWKTKTKIQEAKIKVHQLEINEEMLNDEIRLQINQAYQNYLVSIKKIQVYENAVVQATENYRITKNKNDNALATVNELLDADVALLRSKLNLTDVKADSFLAYNKLLQVTGILNNQ